MNAVVYVSRGGNTRKLAQAVGQAAGAKVWEVKPGQGLILSDVDLLFVGGSLYAGKMDAKLRAFLETLTPAQVKAVAVFGSGAGPGSALSEVQKILAPLGIEVREPAFQCRGAFLFANRGRPNQQDLENAAAFAKKMAEG